MISRIDHRHVARLIAYGRVGLGLAIVTRPALVRAWIGDTVDDRGTKVALRALGARDLVIGAGTLRAADRGEALRPWVTYAAVCDGADALATSVSLRRLPRAALGTVALAAGAAALSLLGRDHVD